MKEISNNGKLKQLKLAVLSNDFEAVEQVFAEYGDRILFATEALGLACRFCGVDMVKLLLDHGVRFNSKPGYTEWQGELLLFSEVDINKTESYITHGVPEELLKKDIISDSERVDVLSLLLDRDAIDPDAALYKAILYDDDQIYQALYKMGIRKMSSVHLDEGWLCLFGRRMQMTGVYAPGNSLEKLHDINYFYRSSLSDFGIDADQVVRIIERLRACGDGRKISTKPKNYFIDYGYKTQYFSKEIRDCFFENTTITETLKNGSRLSHDLVSQGDVGMINYAFENKLLHGHKVIQDMLEYAMEHNASVDIITCIMDENKKCRESSKSRNVYRSSLLLSDSDMKTDDGNEKKP